MKQNFTDITVVLDRSGSMENIKHDVDGGFNAFIEDQKKIQGEAVVTLAQFDDVFEFVYKARNIQEVPSMKCEPRGMTALLDAVGRAMNETGTRLEKMAENERPDRVIFVIITDGCENASHEYSKQRIFDTIKHQRETYSWQFVFLAANQDAIQTGALMGIPMGSSVTFKTTGAGVHNIYTSLSNNVSAYRTGNAQTVSFNDTDRKDAVAE